MVSLLIGVAEWGGRKGECRGALARVEGGPRGVAYDWALGVIPLHDLEPLESTVFLHSQVPLVLITVQEGRIQSPNPRVKVSLNR